MHNHLYRRLAIVALVAGCFAPAGVSAQITVNITDYTGRDPTPNLMNLANTSGAPVTQSECESNATISFSFLNVDTGRARLEFWSGNGCEDPTVRTDLTQTQCRDLDVSVETNNRAQVDVDVDLSRIVAVTDDGECQGDNGVDTIFVLALNQDADTTDAASGQQVSFQIAYDFTGPDAPASFGATGGERAITLSWAASDDQILEYEIYLDEEGCTNGMVDSDLLSDADNPSESAFFATTMESVGATINWPDTVMIGEEVAIAARAIDRADNPGPLSRVVCVERVDVVSFWEEYCRNTPDDNTCRGTSCSIGHVPNPSPVAPFTVALALGALLWWRRR